MRSILAYSLLALSATSIACGDAAAPGDDTSTDDELRELQDLYKDARNLDLGDLLSVSAGFATDAVNDALTGDFAGIRVQPTELYTTADRAEDDLTLKNIDALLSGLTARFGEKELTTEITALRREHLRSSNDKVYAESAFRLSAGANDFTVATGGFESASARLGFTAQAQLEARVIAAHESESEALTAAPLAAIKTARGFVLPRSVADLNAMKPGESYALRGSGALGANLGVGVPILVAGPSAVTYNVVLSAGLRARFEGDIDVQVVRAAGDQLVVDVGLERSSLREAKIALSDGWGVAGLVKSRTNIGSIDVDLGQLVEKALKKRVLDKISLIDASVSQTNRQSRLSVARFRFSLDRAESNVAIGKALAQVLRADLRLAQALANKGEAGVVTEFELARSGVSAASYAGIDIFGMSFFRKKLEADGSFSIETPGGSRSVLFETLQKEGGWFFSSHGYSRTGLSGFAFDALRPSEPKTEANLFLQIVEGDKFMERDKLLDHLDGVVRSVGGEQAFAALEAKGNELQRYVVSACPNSRAFDPCRESVLADATVVALRKDGLAALESQLGGLEAAQKELVLAAGKLRLTAQATLEPQATFVGPKTSIVTDFRLDDSALGAVFARSGGDLAAAARNHLVMARVDRGAASYAADGARYAQDFTATANALGGIFAKNAEEYRELSELEALTLVSHPELGTMGPRAVEIRFTTQQNRPDYDAAVLQSLPQARASVAIRTFDQLVAAAKVSNAPHPEQTVAYSLLALTPGSRADLRLRVQLDTNDHSGQDFKHYRTAGYAGFDLYARGRDVAPIDGGLFNIDDLLNVNQ